MVLEFKKINDQKVWDNFVQKLNRYTFIQSYRYLNVLKVLAEETDGIGIYKESELIGLLPIMVVRAKRGSHLRLKHGPILNKQGWEAGNFDQIVKYLKDYARKKKVNFIRIQPVISETKQLKSSGFNPAPTHNLDAQHTLQLRLADFRKEDFETTKKAVFDNMRKNTRYYIRKAAKEGIEIVEDVHDFENFYQILKQTAGRQEYTTWPRKYYEKLFDEFGLHGLNLYFATYQNKKAAIGLFLDYGKYRFYLEGGMLMNFSKKYPAYAIQGMSIVDALKNNVEIYDFWGGVSPKDSNGEPVKDYPWAGIDLYKRGFGGQEIGMVHPQDLSLSWKYKPTYWFELIEKKRRGY